MLQRSHEYKGDIRLLMLQGSHECPIIEGNKPSKYRKALLSPQGAYSILDTPEGDLL